MQRNLFFPASLCLLFFVAVAASGCQSAKSSVNTLGVIDAERVYQAHPRWADYRRLEEDIASRQQQLDYIRRASQGNTLEAPVDRQEWLARELKGVEQGLAQDMEAKMQAKRAELEKNLNAKMATLKTQLHQEWEQYSAELDKIYQPEILSRQMRLQLVQLTDPEREQVIAELTKMEQERADKLAAKQAELTRRLEAQLAPEQAALEKELQQYHRDQAAAANAALAQKRQELEQRLQTVGPQPGGSGQGDDAGRLEADIAELSRQKEDLHTQIAAEVKAAAAKVAERRGIAAVLVKYGTNISAADLTEQVMQEIKNR